jgi:AcrR family transcriptional regulator
MLDSGGLFARHSSQHKFNTVTYGIVRTLAPVNTAPYPSQMSTRGKPTLNSEDWLLAGFRALVRTGPSALRAEAIARDLATTKGSFYWHFKDLPDYLQKMIGYWEDRAYQRVIDQIDVSLPARERLEMLCVAAVSFHDPAYGGAAAEPALRAWALSNEHVAQAVARMDARRLDYLRALCREAGLKLPHQAETIYAVLVGLQMLSLDGANDIIRDLLGSRQSRRSEP